MDTAIALIIAQLRQQGVPDGFLDQVAQHLPQNANELGHWLEIASVLRRQGNYPASETVYKETTRRFDTSPIVWNNYGILLREWGKIDAALRAFDRAIGLDEGYAKALANKANILEKQHKFPEARALYQAALAIDPKDAMSLNSLGACCLGEGNTAEARGWFEKSLAVDPDFGDALFNLAALHLQSGEAEAALPLAEHLVRLFPDDAEAQSIHEKAKAPAGKMPTLNTPPSNVLGPTGLRPEVDALYKSFQGNPRSVFISYAWPEERTKSFAIRLADDLAAQGFEVFLDRNFDLEIAEVMTLLASCQNVIVLNDRHYAESCLLGQIPVTKPTSPYPSFAFPADEAKSEDYLAEVFKISAITWHSAKMLKDKNPDFAATFALKLADPKAYAHVPGLRIFIEGWRVDEVQMIFSNAARFRSISVAYLDGEHCLSGYPLFDFSNEAYYTYFFEALCVVLEMGVERLRDDPPVPFWRPDFTRHRWPTSDITRAKLWKFTDRELTVWRPSLTPSGDPASAINNFFDWEPL